jgi:hypothetical protein
MQFADPSNNQISGETLNSDCFLTKIMLIGIFKGVGARGKLSDVKGISLPPR